MDPSHGELHIEHLKFAAAHQQCYGRGMPFIRIGRHNRGENEKAVFALQRAMPHCPRHQSSRYGHRETDTQIPPGLQHALPIARARLRRRTLVLVIARQNCHTPWPEFRWGPGTPIFGERQHRLIYATATILHSKSLLTASKVSKGIDEEDIASRFQKEDVIWASCASCYSSSCCSPVTPQRRG